jgi:hypothetical protein
MNEPSFEATDVADTPCDVAATLARWRRALDTPVDLPRTGRIVSACGTLLKVSGLNLRIGQGCVLRAPGAPRCTPK